MAMHVAKIMDGLFMGSKEAAQDLNFLGINKIEGIINTTGHAVPNYASNMGVKYLTFRWIDRPRAGIFGPKGRNIIRIYKYIERIRSNGGSLLVHCIDGVGQSVLVIVCYLMKKFRWGIGKSLELVALKRPDLNPNPAFLHQLAEAADALGLPWNDQSDTFESRWLSNTSTNPVEKILVNTFLNAHSHLYLTAKEQDEQHAEQLREQQEYMARFQGKAGRVANNDDLSNTKNDSKRLVWQDEWANGPSSPEKRPPSGFGRGNRGGHAGRNTRLAISPAHNPLVRPGGHAYGTFSQHPKTPRSILRKPPVKPAKLLQLLAGGAEEPPAPANEDEEDTAAEPIPGPVRMPSNEAFDSPRLESETPPALEQDFDSTQPLDSFSTADAIPSTPSRKTLDPLGQTTGSLSLHSEGGSSSDVGAPVLATPPQDPFSSTFPGTSGSLGDIGKIDPNKVNGGSTNIGRAQQVNQSRGPSGPLPTRSWTGSNSSPSSNSTQQASQESSNSFLNVRKVDPQPPRREAPNQQFQQHQQRFQQQYRQQQLQKQKLQQQRQLQPQMQQHQQLQQQNPVHQQHHVMQQQPPHTFHPQQQQQQLQQHQQAMTRGLLQKYERSTKALQDEGVATPSYTLDHMSKRLHGSTSSLSSAQTPPAQSNHAVQNGASFSSPKVIANRPSTAKSSSYGDSHPSPYDNSPNRLVTTRRGSLGHTDGPGTRKNTRFPARPTTAPSNSTPSITSGAGIDSSSFASSMLAQSSVSASVPSAPSSSVPKEHDRIITGLSSRFDQALSSTNMNDDDESRMSFDHLKKRLPKKQRLKKLKGGPSLRGRAASASSRMKYQGFGLGIGGVRML